MVEITINTDVAYMRYVKEEWIFILELSNIIRYQKDLSTEKASILLDFMLHRFEVELKELLKGF